MPHIDIHDHFRPTPGDPDGGYQLTMPATILLLAGACHDPDATPAGRSRAQATLRQLMALFRRQRYPRAEYLESWLLGDTAPQPRQLLPVLVEACAAVGHPAVAEVIGRALTASRRRER